MFALRSFDPVVVGRDTYRHNNPGEVLDHLVANRSVALLKQLGTVSEFAADVFKNVFDESVVTSTRLWRCAGNLAKIEDQLGDTVRPAFDNNRGAAFYEQRAITLTIENKNRFSAFEWNAQNRPKEVAGMHAKAVMPPNFFLLNEIAGKNCLLGYSNPSLFQEAWVADMMATIEEERRVAKELRRANRGKRKKKGGGKKNKKPVMGIAKKQYDTQTGAAIGGGQYASKVHTGQDEDYEEEEEVVVVVQSSSVDTHTGETAEEVYARQMAEYEKQKFAYDEQQRALAEKEAAQQARYEEEKRVYEQKQAEHEAATRASSRPPPPVREQVPGPPPPPPPPPGAPPTLRPVHGLYMACP
jgi:hypothetical protein